MAKKSAYAKKAKAASNTGGVSVPTGYKPKQYPTGGVKAPPAPVKPKPTPAPAPASSPSASQPAAPYKPPYYNDGPRAVQATPAPAPELPRTAEDRINAQRTFDLGVADVNAGIYRAALDYGDYTTAGKYGPAVTDNPNSALARIIREETQSLTDTGEAANRNNTFFSGLHLRDRGKIADTATRARQEAYTNYIRAVEGLNARRAALEESLRHSNRLGDLANIDAELAKPPEPKGPLLDNRPKLSTPTDAKTAFGGSQLAQQFNALSTRGDQEAYQKYLAAAAKAKITAMLPNEWLKYGKPDQATPTGQSAFGGTTFNNHFNKLSGADQKAFVTYMVAAAKAGKKVMDPWEWVQKGRPK